MMLECAPDGARHPTAQEEPAARTADAEVVLVFPRFPHPFFAPVSPLTLFPGSRCRYDAAPARSNSLLRLLELAAQPVHDPRAVGRNHVGSQSLSARQSGMVQSDRQFRPSLRAICA